MATAAFHGQCYTEVPLGQPLPTSTQRKHTLGKKRVPLRKRVVLHHALRVQSQAGFGCSTVKIKEEESLIEVEPEPEPEPEGGKKNFIKLPGTVKLQGTGQPRSKDNKVVFVAGATGKVGSRTVRELLKLGFQVRASTRNVEKAEALLENASDDAEPEDTRSFAIFSPAKLFGFLKPKPGKMLEIVKCDLEDAESIEPALGNAGVVVCCIGASEKEVLDVTGPYRIDFKATQNLIDAACAAQVNHFVLLTSLGTQKFGFPAAVLNLFWGVLLWKAKAEKALIQCGLPYTIVRPGGMERPTDAYKETHNLTLAEADKLFGGQVSNLQVAELIASIVENQDVSINKIVEAVAETTAPLRPIRELLEAIPASNEKILSAEPQSTKKARPSKVDVSVQKISKKQEEEKIAEERRIQAQKDEEAKGIQAQKDKEARLKLEALRKKYEKEIQAAKEKEEAAKTASMAALAEKAELERRAVEIQAKAEAAALAASQAKALEAAVLAAARKGNVLSDEEKQKILESVKLERLQKVITSEEIKVSSKKTPAFSFFGRLAPSTTVTETSTDTELSGAQWTAEAKKEKERADAEAKAKADEEAATKLAAEKQLKEKEKKEEAKRLAEQEAARALEAKKKEEQEAARALEAKKKEEQEAARVLEAKKKEEQEKAEKEAKELAEQAAAKAAEAKRNEEEKAETKRKEEQEKAEKLKKEAENKAKALAEQEAAESEKLAKEKAEQEVKDAKEAAVASAPAPQKGFRWFWQPAEPEPSELEPSAEFASTGLADVAVDTKTIELPPSSTRFPELRPPSPPIPSPQTLAKKTEASIETPSSASSVEENAGESIKTILLEDVAEKQDGSLSDETAQEAEARKKLVMETVAREKEALEKAKSATAFLWPWQKQESEPQPAEQSENALTLPASDQVEKQETQTLPPSSRPLSPYTMFPGLKPPSPPIPSPPVLKSETVTVPKVELVSSEVNRVEQAIEKVKLPDVNSEKDKEAVAEETSEESKEDIEARKVLVQEVAAREKEALEKAKAASAFMWPWQKPKPAEEQSPPPSKEAGKPESETLPASSRPLSPYTQFPNLKPPTPPAPSPPMQNTIAEEPKAVEMLSRQSTPLSPYPGFPDLKPPPSSASLPVKTSENGAVPEKNAGTDENILEPSVSSGFKWPWQ